MKEEKVTLNIIKWLQENGWGIICYDFPQSGTGIMLHPNFNEANEKNKGGIIPDIIATKDNQAVFFENKDRFYLDDFIKINQIKKYNQYSQDLKKLVGDRTIFYGIGFPNLQKYIVQSQEFLNMIDFLIVVWENEIVSINYDIKNIFV